METIGRILDLVARALAAIAAAAGAAIFAFILAAVVMRYLVAAPFRFTEELSGLLLAMMVFLAMPMALVRDLNIRVTLVTDSLPALARRVAWIASELILVAFATIFAWQSWNLVAFHARLGLKSEQARLELWPWLAVMTACVALCALVGAWKATRQPPSGGGMHI
ncbi:MAG: TRAP transporter small permease [Alphaproteobacteria bacterium]|jgi:TRAP-type C4-dicarboxylate transport system permease small subunit